MAYNRTFWEDDPSTNTPINADNLNNIEEGLVDHDERIEALEEGGGSGHIIVDENGNDMPAESRMQFVGAGVIDGDGKTVIQILPFRIVNNPNGGYDVIYPNGGN